MLSLAQRQKAAIYPSSARKLSRQTPDICSHNIRWTSTDAYVEFVGLPQLGLCCRSIAPAVTIGGLLPNVPGSNVVNYESGADWNGLNGNVTTVGSAGPLSQSFYGTLDQGGNVREWIERLVNNSSRTVRGGAYNMTETGMYPTLNNIANPTDEVANLGFRVATVPEPSTLALAGTAFGIVALWWRSLRHRK